MANFFEDILPSAPTTTAQAPSLGSLVPFNRMAQDIGRRIESAGASLGQRLGNFFDDLLPEVKPTVRGRTVTRPSDAAIYAREILPAIAETLPTEAARFLTPNALALQAVTAGTLRGFAGTRLGQFPIETIPGLGFLRRFGAPQIFEPITKPKGRNYFEDIAPETVREAQVIEPPRGLPAPRALTPTTAGGMVAEGSPPPYETRLPAIRPVGLRPAPSLPAETFAQTHPGLALRPPIAAGRLIQTPAPGAPVVPITRQEADQLLGQSVELRTGLLAPKAFRVVPPDASDTATGLQYWYKYDLPSSSGLRYPTRSVPTPSEALEVRQPTAKEPWQMTKEAFNKTQAGGIIHYVNNLKRANLQEITELTKQMVEAGFMTKDDLNEVTTLALGEGGTEVPAPPGLSLIAAFHNLKTSAFFAHKNVVQKSISEGKPVPSSIRNEYKDYPDFPRVAEPQGKYRPSQPLVRVRQQAIQAVARELREQSVILNQQRLSLRKRVLEHGGIKPTLAGGLREELQAIRPFLRQGGQAIDDLATELGFENGEALRTALVSGQGARLPKLAELQRQATQIVDSASGGRIMEVLQTKGATSKAITSVVKDVTRQVARELSQGQRQVRGILTAAQRKAMTPAQLARFARVQRVEPGATTLGPRGATREAPLTPADIRRVEATTAQIVPRPGQPTGTPPIIPTSRALIPANAPRPVRDLNQFQSTPFSGLDPSRAAQVIDNRPLGPTERRVIQPLRQGELAMKQDQQRTLFELRRVSGDMRRGSPERSEVFALLEGRQGIPISPKARETAGWMAQQFDPLRARVNEARASIGKRPIIRRQNYITHIKDPTFWEAMREAFGNVPEEASVTLADKFFESLRARGPGFRFGLPRKGGPFEEDAIAAFEAYLPAAMRVIHLSTPSRLASVCLDRSLAGTPNAYKYFSQLIRQASTGEAGFLAKVTPQAWLRASNWLRGRFGKGTILGNLSSVLQQPFTLPATIAATGPDKATTAVFWLSRGDGLSFASSWSKVMQSRVMELD